MNIKSVIATLEALVFGKINLLLLVTNLCNSKCTICSYWQQEKHNLPVYIIKQLLNSKIVNKNGITLEGGEAILHPDIKEILYLLKDCNYSLLTNGLLPDILEKLVVDFKIPNVSISIDGPKETYKKIRGVDGYETAIYTALSLRNKTNLSICFTISPQNTFEDYLHIKEFCDYHKIPLLLNIYSEMEYSGKRFTDKPIDERYDKLSNKYVSQYNRWVKGGIKSNCFGIRYICNVFPDGKVVLCQARQDVVFGNLYEKTIDEIWKQRPKVKCNECWMSCNRYLEAKWIIS